MTEQAVVSLTDVTEGLTSEGVDLRDMAEEPGGAWTPGWYAAETIDGYATAKSGKQFNTEDTVSQGGDSRNLRVCFRVINAKGDERTMQESLNYRITDFVPERISYVKQLRQELKNVRHWPDKDAQRSSLAIAKLSQLQKALGIDRIAFVNGGIAASIFVGGKLDAHLRVDDNGYNVVSEFATAGTKTQRKRG